MYDRRRFITNVAKAAGAAAAGVRLVDPEALVAEALGASPDLPSYIADLSGNGTLASADLKLVRRALGSRRGLDIVPQEGYDYRADVFGSGKIDRAALKAVRKARNHFRKTPSDARARPVTVCWHYGWYNFPSRRPRQHHVWYKGGAYSSRSPSDEAEFNDLKNEFGITVDALSWADPKADGNLNRNVELGYLQAPNGRTRYAALLYESLISLRASPGDRIDFRRNLTRKRLVQHYRDMARFFQRIDDSRVRTFRIDGRPVIFMYASHTWGTNVDGTGIQYDRIDEAMENAVTNFEAIYGVPPYVIGEETTFAETDRFDAGRQRRSANFDAVFVYHHATGADFIVRGGENLRGAYVDQVKEVLGHTYDGVLEHRNRFTDRPLYVVPSLAAGFSKVDVPTLFANRSDYADFLKEMIRFHEDNFMVPRYGQGGLGELPPVVSVGAWNEEWEGHSVMPSQFNRTLSPRTQKGFDFVMAIKQAFGWNHYMDRGVSPAL